MFIRCEYACALVGRWIVIFFVSRPFQSSRTTGLLAAKAGSLGAILVLGEGSLVEVEHLVENMLDFLEGLFSEFHELRRPRVDNSHLETRGTDYCTCNDERGVLVERELLQAEVCKKLCVLLHLLPDFSGIESFCAHH